MRGQGILKHYGDITKLNGAELPIVDVIIGGSPCQDLSVAGQRKGLAGERSGLFMEQIRIIKEMREHDRASGRADKFIRPRYMVWENVPGAFSSNKGEDFRTVLEETAKIADENAVIPRPPGKWTGSGCIMGDGWSIAWRVHDAQFWGVPQRRRRIALVADFGGESAPEILFERKGLPRDIEESGTEREETAGAVGDGTEKASVGLDLYNHIISGDIAVTLNASSCDSPAHSGPSVLCLNDQGGQKMSVSENQTGTLRAQEHGHQPIVYNGENITSPLNKSLPKAGDPCHTLGTDSRNYLVKEEVVYCLQGNGIDRADTAGCNGRGWRENKSYTLNTVDRPAVAYSFDSLSSNSMNSKNLVSGCREVEISKTLDCFDPNPSKNQGGIAIVQSVYDARGNGDGNICPTITGDHENRITDYTAVCICRQETVVRRLTTLECERLQGYPDGWTDIGEWKDSKGKKHKDADSSRYKALGNSIALPFWQWMAQRICNQYDRQVTMGSLFDGISGFPLVFARCGATPLWTSEIEEFPIAVCKRHFGDEDAGIEGDLEKYL